jgi:excisionase family DNA binding protein
MHNPDFYLVEELASKLRVNKMTIYRYIKAKKLSAFRLGKEYRIEKAEVNRLLEANRA